MNKKCVACGYDIEDCNDWKGRGYIACCPDCKHIVEEEEEK